MDLRIVIGADHAGFRLKETLKIWLGGEGFEVEDVGTFNEDSVDYPDLAGLVSQKVADGEFERGILICGSGLGVAMAANKVPGIRAASCLDEECARLSREHNDANIIGLGARLTDEDKAKRILRIWLNTKFSGGRHSKRIDKMRLMEKRGGPDES